MSAKVVVSDVLDELVLGIDWLSKNNCRWDFNNATFQIESHTIQLCKKRTRDMFRRIYAVNKTAISPKQVADISVQMIWNGLHEPKCD